MHRPLILAAALALAGCATTLTPEQLAQRSDWDVCAATMGGASSLAAQHEAARRALDCAPLYPAISAQRRNALAGFMAMQAWQANNAAMFQPAPAAPAFGTSTTCRVVRVTPTVSRAHCD